MVNLKTYDHATPFLDAELIPRDHHAHVFFYKKKMFHPFKMVCKAASVAQVSRSGIFHVVDAAKEM